MSQIAVRHDHQDGQRHRKNHPEYGDLTIVANGGLMGYGADRLDIYRRAASSDLVSSSPRVTTSNRTGVTSRC